MVYDPLRFKQHIRGDIPWCANVCIRVVFIRRFANWNFMISRIAWPIHGDQPALSISISAVLDVAYRLVEGGIGSGLLPRYGGYQPKGTSESVVQEFKDVWAKAQGEDGARKRLNVQILQEKVRALWKVNGSSLRNFKTFADYCSKN